MSKLTNDKQSNKKQTIKQERKRQDFDLRFPLAQRQNQLFQDTLPPKINKKRMNKQSKNRTSSSTATKQRKERIINNTRRSSIKYSNNNANASFIPCSICKRLYKIDTLDIHISQCAFLSSHEKKKTSEHTDVSATTNLEEEQLFVNDENSGGKETNRVNNKIRRKTKVKNTNYKSSKFQSPVFTHNRVKFTLFNNNRKGLSSTNRDNNVRETAKEPPEIKKESNYQDYGSNTCSRNVNRHKNVKKNKGSLYKRSERDWKYFTKYASTALDYTIKYSNVPFPPIEDIDQLHHFVGITYDELSANKRKDDHHNLTRCRVRMAMIRWHPDKFQQKFGTKLCKIDRDRILQKVKECSQEINALRNEKISIC